MNTDTLFVIVLVVLALLVAFLGHKVSALVDLKTVTPFVTEVYTRLMIEAELKARATATPIDDMIVTAGKSLIKDNVTVSNTEPLEQPSKTE